MVPKELEGFVETVGNRLQGRGWRVVTRRTSECRVQIIPIRKRLIPLVLCLGIVQHGVVCLPCFKQTLLQAMVLVLVRIQVILKRFHTSSYIRLEK